MSQAGLPDFGQRLDFLFESSCDPATGRPFTNVAVAQALSGRGVSVSHAYLGQLRKGRKSEPTASLLGALAQFFGVSADYFFATASRLEPRELARRLNRLVSSFGNRFHVDDLVSAVARSETFTAGEWEQLRSGDNSGAVREDILGGIAAYFDVPQSYLTDPERSGEAELVEAQLDLVEAMAETGSTALSLRSIGAPTAEALREIAAALRSARGEIAEDSGD